MTSSGEKLAFVGTSDLTGLIRGKAFPAADWDKRAASGVGWTPTNVQITCFDVIAPTPFGSFGDLVLVPDPATRFHIPAEGEVPEMDFAFGAIRSLEGEPWSFCTRSIALRALDELQEVAGLSVLGAFEHEFQLPEEPSRAGDNYGYRGFRAQQGLGETLVAMMRSAGLGPDTFMKEYGPSQYEITCAPAPGITAADHAAALRLLVHEAAGRHGTSATFAPILDPESVGNGVHVHLSLRDGEGNPATYDAGDPHGMSAAARHFVGGILAHLDQILCFLAPSDISYLRLTPHRWSAAYNNLGYRDREASVRICPVAPGTPDQVARRFNFEVRACDAAASPHLVLAALVFAGAEGLRQKIEPPAVTEEDLSELSPSALAERGFQRLPESLPEALDRMQASEAVAGWFGADFTRLYADHKRAEIAALGDLSPIERCQRYREVY